MSSSQNDSAVPPMAIGSKIWPGLAKLAEECGEVQQNIAKLMAYPDGTHPDGDERPLIKRLEDEMGDVLAAVHYVLESNPELDGEWVALRRHGKLRLFMDWHDEERHRAA